MSVIIEYDLKTWEIRRIIHPESDEHLVHHPVQPGWGQLVEPHEGFPLHPVTQVPLYTLSACGDAVERATGRRPPNA